MLLLCDCMWNRKSSRFWGKIHYSTL